MPNEKKQFSISEVEDFIWLHLCKTYNEDGKDGLDFAPLCGKEEEVTPSKQEVSRAAHDLEVKGHIEKRVTEEELWIELTPVGKKNCEGIDIASSWCV